VPAELGGGVCPHCGAQGLLASVEIASRMVSPPTDEEQRLHEMIPHRHTDRQPFLGKLEMGKAVTLELAACKEGADAKLLYEGEVKPLLERVARASAKLERNAGYRAVLEEWTGDGARDKQGYGVPAGRLAPRPKRRRHPPVRDLGLTWGGGRCTEARYEKHPYLIALWARTDTPPDWMRMGQALQRVLLTATRYDVDTSLLTQLLEVDELERGDEEPGPWHTSPTPFMVIRVGCRRDPGNWGRPGPLARRRVSQPAGGPTSS